MGESHFIPSILLSRPQAMCGRPTSLSGGPQIPLFAFSTGLHLERGRIVGPSVGRLPPSQVKERGGDEGLVLIFAPPARSISRVRRPGAHLQALPGAGALKQRIPLQPPLRSRALHLVTRRARRGRGAEPRELRPRDCCPELPNASGEAGGYCGNPRQCLCRALALPGGEIQPPPRSSPQLSSRGGAG